MGDTTKFIFNPEDKSEVMKGWYQLRDTFFDNPETKINFGIPKGGFVAMYNFGRVCSEQIPTFLVHFSITNTSATDLLCTRKFLFVSKERTCMFVKMFQDFLNANNFPSEEEFDNFINYSGLKNFPSPWGIE